MTQRNQNEPEGSHMPPPGVRPFIARDQHSQKQGGGMLYKIGIAAIILVVLAGSASLVLPAILDYVGSPRGPEPIYLENMFIDIDSDGDQDFVQDMHVLLNCAGQLCEPEPAPAPQATGGVPLETPDTPPTPQVFPTPVPDG
jgi:hypothetical protein